MFKKLKDKIAEEVKSSPQRIQQIAQAAQAVVSSASSTTSEVSGSENFFSITEEETPHNSPLRKNPISQTSLGSKANLATLNNGIPSRSRRVSNSSMASDASFRLPSYDSPAVYHLQSDMETSAGEESTMAVATNIQLDSITKDQLYQAYRKILDRYQKYRGRYAELAQRYRDLERDNNKARAVLVETQDKALRRLCELREQCSLEQQAKAHLEAALRLEMDELQCVNKTLMSKLALGENSENLIQIENQSIDEKMDKMKLDDEKIIELTQKLFEANEKVKELQTREEENTILLAENKMMIHSELENKETEVKRLHIHLASFENSMKQSSLEREKLQDTISHLKLKLTETETKYSNLNLEKKELEKKIDDFQASKTENDSILNTLEYQLTEMKETKSNIEKLNEKLLCDNNLSLEKIQVLEKNIDEFSENTNELKVKLDVANVQIESLQNEKIKFTENIESFKLHEEKINEMAIKENNQIIKMTEQIQGSNKEKELNCKEISQLKERLEIINIDFKNISEEKNLLQIQNEQLLKQIENNKDEINNLTQKIVELKYTNTRNENTDSEAIKSMKLTIIQLKDKHNVVNKELNNMVQEKSNEMKQLIEDKKKLNEKLVILQNEQEIAKSDVTSLRGKIESLKNDKRDLEKTLEKEIREKGELKIQVTNILQEIGRLEDQLKEVKNSHSLLQNDKINLQMNMELMQTQNLEQFNKYQKEETEKLQLTIEEFEKEILKIKSDNSILSEKNSILEQNLLRLENDTKDNENTYHHLANENIKKLNEKLSLCLNENTELLNSKELLEHEFRSLQDEYELKNKEKLCLLDTYKTLEVEIYNLKAEKILLNDKIKDLELTANQNSNLEKKNKKLENEHNNLVLQLDSLQNEIKDVTDEKNNFNKIFENLQKEYNLLKDEFVKIDQEKNEQSDKLNALITQKETRLMELEEFLEKTRDEKNMLKESINKNDADFVKKNENYEELKIENQYLNTLVKQLEGEQIKSDEGMAELNKNNNELLNVQSENMNKIEILMAEMETEKKKLLMKENEVVECKKGFENYIKQIIEFEKNLAKLSNENKDLKSKNDEFKNLVEDFQAQILNLNHEINNLLQNQKIKNDETLKQENCVLNEENKVIREQLNNNLVLNSDNLLQEKKNLEIKLQKIMNEVQDVSIRNLFLEQKCENYLILEQSNERLKLANEKLSRQLDETLVSIQHHEGLSANTEFEYLKNIMFQYLSGNINKNNSTLVKVIAAVLKFTPQQTQIIIEKELQRNSLLGQLNLL